MTLPQQHASGGGEEPSPVVRRYVAWLLKYGRWVWLVGLVLAVPASIRTIGLYAHLKSDVEELLPRRAPSVTALEELRQRMPGLRYLGIIVDTGSAANLPAAERFLDDLAARIEHYPPTLVAAVRTGVSAEQRFVEAHAPLFVDVEDLQTIRDRIEAVRDAAVSRGMGLDLDDDQASEPPRLDLSDIEAKYRAREKEARRFPSGRFSSAEKKLSLLLVQAAEFTTGTRLGRELLTRVEHDIADLGGLDHYAPGMRVGYTGDIAINVEELTALEQDLVVASSVVLVLVLAVVVTFYRWWAAAWALLLPLGVATLDTFAAVTLPPMRLTGLNSNTAFLGSVIVGNGVNTGIILLARYVEERRRGRGIEEALALAVAGSRRGTFAAALAASASYGALMLTEFRGFNQFGVIGGLGMVLSWSMTFLLGPPLIAWLDRNDGSLRRQPPLARPSLMTHVAAFVTHRHVAILVGAGVLTLLAAVKLKGVGRDWIEYDFSKLRRADTHRTGEGYWGRKMDDLVGHYLTPLVVLTDTPAQARDAARRLRRAISAPPLSEVVASVRSADDLVGTDQDRKIALVNDIRRDLTPRIRASMTPEQRDLVDRYLGHGPLEPIRPADLPESITAGLRERDGTIDRAVLVYPRPSRAMWQGASIVSLTSALRSAVATTEGAARPARLAGSLPLSADIITSIERDGPRATLVAFSAVVAIVVLMFRFSGTTPLILGSLVLAVTWLCGAMLALGIKVNFCNFVAFPITFGIGVEYAVNIMTRVREGRGQPIGDVLRTTGGAVGLCSVTTVIGYGSLLFAQNRALFSFGVVAVLGEIACLTTAIVVLPSILMTRREPRTVAGSFSDPRPDPRT